jgi:hypothetical protein
LTIDAGGMQADTYGFGGAELVVAHVHWDKFGCEAITSAREYTACMELITKEALKRTTASLQKTEDWYVAKEVEEARIAGMPEAERNDYVRTEKKRKEKLSPAQKAANACPRPDPCGFVSIFDFAVSHLCIV